MNSMNETAAIVNAPETAAEALALAVLATPDLGAYVQAQARHYRLQGGPYALLVAEALDDLACDVRACQTPGVPLDPATYRARIKEMDDYARRDQWQRAEEQGYARGLRAAR
jgi:hypothetical protein